MRSERILGATRVLAFSTIIAAMFTTAVAATHEIVLYRFAGGNDGEYADTELVRDHAGNLYGTTVQGGTGSGTVFQLTPAGVHNVLYSFMGGSDGAEPYKGVTLGHDGSLYGTTVAAGLYSGACVDTGCGVIFKLTNSGGTWTQSVIYSFTGGNDGFGPGSPVVFDKDGNLYGTTPTGGATGFGVVFQLTPDASGNWHFNLLHTFTGGNDGSSPAAGRLLVDALGCIYGVATTGGAHGKGTAFKLSPTSSGTWKFTTLYAFRGQPDAGFPYGGLVPDENGHLYGTTYHDGAQGLGSIYELTHRNGAWEETVLYSFHGGTDGSNPISTLTFDKKGNLYGTSSEGGARCNCGTIFKLAPSTNGHWTETVAHRFSGAPDGSLAYNGMVRDPEGIFYGTTVRGGNSDETVGDGVIYKFTPQ